eukprot:m.42027 g.42027  ORF g.42027 m.42027 type:complete len:219 (-) comp10482_c0_seq2:98-754(-)
MGLCGCDSIALGFWVGLVFLTTVVITVAFTTSYWVEVEDQLDEYGYDAVSIGLIYSCLTLSGRDEVCGQYGKGLSDIPVSQWKGAALFYGMGVFFGWVLCVVSIFSFCSEGARGSLRFLMTASASLTTLGLLIFAGGLGALKYNEDSASIFSNCVGAGPFNAGSTCKFGDSGIVACVGLGMSLISCISSFLVIRTMPKKETHEKLDAIDAQRTLVQKS